jgi:hypothetical protein
VLKMKTHCERCDSSLESEAPAYICTFECTFCDKCTREMGGVCPNCSGELLARPRRGKIAVEADPPAKWSESLSGQCHCGAVSLEVANKPESLTECNCSICRRYGAQWAYYTRETARINHAPGAVSRYSWSDREIEFFHCNRCGCMTHYESMEKPPDSRIAVNTRMFTAAETAQVPVRHFDGADTWTFLDNK